MDVVKKILSKYTIILVLIALILLFPIINPVFFIVTNLMNIFVQQSYVIIAAVGLAFIMIAGGMDLSVGYEMSLVCVMTAVAMMKWHLPVVVSILIGLAVGELLGVFNGIATVKLKVHPLIVTLGTMTIYQGVSYIISKSESIYGLPASFKFFGQGYVGPIPFSVIIMLVVVVAASWILKKTYFGRYVYSIGSNDEAARLAGVNVDRIKILVFVISGVLVALSAIILTGRAGSATSATGPGTEFTCMTACILGGVSFKGGSGKIWGVVVGVLILGVLSSGMQIIGLGTYPQFVAKGFILLIAVGIDNYQKMAKVKK